MEQLKIRLLTAREIECRIAQIGKKGDGLSILLYKDARCDMAILDEVFGPMGWQRHHSRDNANCIVSIWDAEKEQWIDKEDVGTESNTEAVKGLASDSFKRACVNVGIGRELYAAPFIWIKPPNCTIQNDGGKLRCYDKFEVKEIGYNEHREINMLVIVNAKTQAVVWEYGTGKRRQTAAKPATAAPEATPDKPSTPAPKAAEKPAQSAAGLAPIGTPATDEQKTYLKEHLSNDECIDLMTEYGADLENLPYNDAKSRIEEIERNSAQYPRCERCDTVITGTVLPDGTRMTASELIGKSKVTYNGVYCFKCMKALKKAAKEKGGKAS